MVSLCLTQTYLIAEKALWWNRNEVKRVFMKRAKKTLTELIALFAEHPWLAVLPRASTATSDGLTCFHRPVLFLWRKLIHLFDDFADTVRLYVFIQLVMLCN
jgi:hypothetical protein